MAEYASYYLRTEGGRCPVEEFIDGLQVASQRKFFYKRGLLEEFGPKLPQPHAKRLAENLYELRFEGHEGQIRRDATETGRGCDGLQWWVEGC